MKQIIIIDSPNFNDFVNNIDYYSNQFVLNGVIAYRNANFSKEQQYKIMQKIGDNLNWYPKTGYDNYIEITYYQENHKRKYRDDSSRLDKEKILLDFHMEHPYYTNPIVAATWNMHLFSGSSKNGRTAFVDTSRLYESMPEKWQIFLLNCVEIIKKNTKISHNAYELKTHKIQCVQSHWFNNNLTIRMNLDPQENFCEIEFIDGKRVTEKDLFLFQKIKNFIFNEILKNNDIRLYHEWQQGDLVVVDLFKMAHAVYGGFLPEEREFFGYWAYKNKVENQWLDSKTS